jgi:hypothetical protein
MFGPFFWYLELIEWFMGVIKMIILKLVFFPKDKLYDFPTTTVVLGIWFNRQYIVYLSCFFFQKYIANELSTPFKKKD